MHTGKFKNESVYLFISCAYLLYLTFLSVFDPSYLVPLLSNYYLNFLMLLSICIYYPFIINLLLYSYCHLSSLPIISFQHLSCLVFSFLFIWSNLVYFILGNLFFLAANFLATCLSCSSCFSYLSIFLSTHLIFLSLMPILHPAICQQRTMNAPNPASPTHRVVMRSSIGGVCKRKEHRITASLDAMCKWGCNSFP